MTARTAGRPPSARAAAATLVVTVLLLLAGGAGLTSGPAAAAEPCVGVIVDARLLGGDVRTGCAEGDPDSGLEALSMAGFRYAFVPRQPGLVCQIDGLPECSRTSTTTYWSYWYRAKGSDRWVYASQGAGAHDPEPGATEAWVWQEGGRRQPPDIGLRTICPQVAAPAPERSPTSQPARTKRPATPTAGAAQPTRRAESTGTTRRTTGKPASSSRPATSAPASATSAATSAPPSATTPAATSPPATATAAAEPTTTPVAQRSEGAASDGPPWVGLAVGGALVAVLGAAALVRGRRSGGSP